CRLYHLTALPTLLPYTTLFRSHPDGLGPQLHAERLPDAVTDLPRERDHVVGRGRPPVGQRQGALGGQAGGRRRRGVPLAETGPRSESTRLNSSHVSISYAVFCL